MCAHAVNVTYDIILTCFDSIPAFRHVRTGENSPGFSKAFKLLKLNRRKVNHKKFNTSYNVPSLKTSLIDCVTSSNFTECKIGQ